MVVVVVVGTRVAKEVSRGVEDMYTTKLYTWATVCDEWLLPFM